MRRHPTDLGGAFGRIATAACMALLASGCSSSSSNTLNPGTTNDGSADSGSPNPGSPGSGDSGNGGAGSDGMSPQLMDAGGSGNDAGPDAGTGTGDSTGVVATKVSDFLGSLGVCTHVAQGVDSPLPSATAMVFAGIHNLRDDGNPDTVPGWISMYQQSGVRTNILPNGDLPTTIMMAEQLQAAGALLSVEGPNEPNNFPITYMGQTSDYNSTFAPVASFQRDLYAAVKADPKLAGIPVFHSSEAGGSEPDNVGLQFLTIPSGAGTTMPDGTKYADYGNTHNYVCGHSSQLVDNTCWNAEDPTLNGDWDGAYVEYGHTWHGGFTGYSNADLTTLPKVTTETGWTTTGDNSITQEQQARLFMNLYLSAFKRGWSYTFIYMLRDDPNQGYWGLFDTNYQPKTSGTYMHNLTTVLADTGSSTTGKLNYSIASEPVTVHDLLVQKSDGTFELVVWDEHPGGGSDSITVDLGTSRSVVKVYDPTTGTSPTQTLNNASSVPLMLTDHPVILEI